MAMDGRWKIHKAVMHRKKLLMRRGLALLRKDTERYILADNKADDLQNKLTSRLKVDVLDHLRLFKNQQVERNHAISDVSTKINQIYNFNLLTDIFQQWTLVHNNVMDSKSRKT